MDVDDKFDAIEKDILRKLLEVKANINPGNYKLL